MSAGDGMEMAAGKTADVALLLLLLLFLLLLLLLPAKQRK
jgi:hypothetical protein